jgi:hypothetical protein
MPRSRATFIPDPQPSSIGSICHGIPLQHEEDDGDRRDQGRAVVHRSVATVEPAEAVL